MASVYIGTPRNVGPSTYTVDDQCYSLKRKLFIYKFVSKLVEGLI